MPKIVNLHEVHIYTDGAAKGNPGPAGYGVVMELVGTPHKKEFYEGFRKSTNNRMELLAVIVGLEKLKNTNMSVLVVSDSKYVVDAIEKKWLHSWVKIGFNNKKNPDLWRRILPLLKSHKTTFHWVKGHAGHLENEICDQLAVKAAQTEPLQIDEFFENLKNDGLF